MTFVIVLSVVASLFLGYLSNWPCELAVNTGTTMALAATTAAGMRSGTTSIATASLGWNTKVSKISER